MTSDITLDFAQDVFEANKNAKTASRLFILAVEYWEDGAISDATLAEIAAQCAPYFCE